MNGPAVTVERVEAAMEKIAIRMGEHVAEQGSSPFTVIFERLEGERALLVRKREIEARARDYLKDRTSPEIETE